MLTTHRRASPLNQVKLSTGLDLMDTRGDHLQCFCPRRAPVAHLVRDVVAVLQQQVHQSVCPQQEANQLIQQKGGLDESDGSTEDGG